MNKKHEQKPLTDWEVGQMLIDFSDKMTECNEFRTSHPKVYREVQKARLAIGDAFEDLKSHSFGIASNNDKTWMK